MFRRKDEGVESMETTTENTTETVAPVTTAAAAPAAAPATAPAAQMAPAFRPVPPQAAMAAARPAAQPLASLDRTAPRANTGNKRVLSIGPDIQMKGEITSCDRVIVEGSVDAVMRDVHTVEIAETGAMKGTAEVEDAEISGGYEGDLVVRGKLTVYASGRVRGNVTYGEIEIQRGGQISGNIRNVADAKAANNAANQTKRAAA